MSDVIEVSYTGDLLAHRRCPRSWAYEKHVGFRPYEQVQAMEGRLLHHAMEWLTKFYGREGRHALPAELDAQLSHYFRVLWARGMRTAFSSRRDTIDRVLENLYPGWSKGAGTLHPTVRAAVEGAQHTEYELRTVKRLLPLQHDGKQRLLLTGILDLVIQQDAPLVYQREWKWSDRSNLAGKVHKGQTAANKGDLEIWDYKGTRGDSPYMRDYVLQLLTYANLYRERTGDIPCRCVLFFVNEPKREDQLVCIPLDEQLLVAALQWTVERVRALQDTVKAFQADPATVIGGDGSDANTGLRTVSKSLADQCTACGFRFDCDTYIRSLDGAQKHRDVSLTDVFKN